MPRDGAGDRIVTLSFAIEDALVRQNYEDLNHLLEAREEALLLLEAAGEPLPAGVLANLREVDARILKQLKLTRDALGQEIKASQSKKPPVRSYRTGTGGSIDLAS